MGRRREERKVRQGRCGLISGRFFVVERRQEERKARKEGHGLISGRFSVAASGGKNRGRGKGNMGPEIKTGRRNRRGGWLGKMGKKGGRMEDTEDKYRKKRMLPGRIRLF